MSTEPQAPDRATDAGAPASTPTPTGLRSALGYTVAAAALFALGLLGGWLSIERGWLRPHVAPRAELLQALRDKAEQPPGEIFAHILATNLQATATLIVAGVATAGLFAAFHQCWFGAAIGYHLALYAQGGVATSTIAAFIVPHALVEVPAFCLAAGVGLRAGVLFSRYLASGELPPPAVARQALVAGAVALLVLVPLAAVLEAYWTPAVGLRALG